MKFVSKDEVDQKIKAGEFPEIIVNVSGGKDSVMALLYILELQPPSKIKMVFRNSPLLFPDVKLYVEWLAKELGVELETLELKRDVMGKILKTAEKEGMIEHGNNRYCKTITKYEGDIEPVEGGLKVLGTRYFESTHRRMRIYFTKQKSYYTYMPIIDKTTDQVWSFFRQSQFPLHWSYKYESRLSCAFCPLMSVNGLAFIRKYYPEFFEFGKKWLNASLKVKSQRPAQVSVLKQLIKRMKLSYVHNLQVLPHANGLKFWYPSDVVKKGAQ